MLISELMTRDVKCCGPNEPLSAACRVMWENDCGCVPVLDREGRAVGLITDRDVAMAAYIQGRPTSHLRVADSMARELITCSPDDSASAALRMMAEAQVNRLPVCDRDGKLVGLVSLADLARAASAKRGGAQRVEADELVTTLAAVRRARVVEPARAVTRVRRRGTASAADSVSS
jgi:CBS domain-containing protein